MYARRRDQDRRDAWWTWFTSTYDLQATLFLDETAKDPRSYIRCALGREARRRVPRASAPGPARFLLQVVWLRAHRQPSRPAAGLRHSDRACLRPVRLLGEGLRGLAIRPKPPSQVYANSKDAGNPYPVPAPPVPMSPLPLPLPPAMTPPPKKPKKPTMPSARRRRCCRSSAHAEGHGRRRGDADAGVGWVKCRAGAGGGSLRPGPKLRAVVRGVLYGINVSCKG